jgi:hypothetical protein
MKHLKTFENQSTNAYVFSVIHLDGNTTDNYVFMKKEDMENYILNYVNQDIIETYGSDDQESLIQYEPTDYDSCIEDEDGVPGFTNWEKAFEWYNDNYINNEEISMRIDYNECKFVSNVQLDDRTKKLIDIKNYNI